MWQSAQAGLSAREIGRRLSRDHYTVVRHTAASRFDDLVGDLALTGQFDQARLLLKQRGSQDSSMTLQLIDECEELVQSWVRALPPFPL
jgi:hypothetical protein